MCYVRSRTSTILWDDVATKHGHGIWNLECEGSGSLKPVGVGRMYITYIGSAVGQKGKGGFNQQRIILSSLETGMKIIKDRFVFCISACNSRVY